MKLVNCERQSFKLDVAADVYSMSGEAFLAACTVGG